MTSSKADGRPLVILAAGGTGGHMFPARAFAEEMRRRGWRIGLVTDDRGLRFADGFPADWIEEIRASTLSARAPHRAPRAIINMVAGFLTARRRLSRETAQLAVGFGGYPSFPTLAAALSLSKPVLIHEQNAVLGRVNRLLAHRARVIACAFERLDRLPPSAASRKHVVGNPVRAAIRALRDQPYPEISASGRLRLLVTGGSQGARMFGDVVPDAVRRLPPEILQRLFIVQQARADQVEAVSAAYARAGTPALVQPFFSDMHDQLAAAHLVIGRAGASTVSELAVSGRPSILVPLAIAMDDHQTANARYLADAGAADILSERNFTPEALAERLTARLTDWGDLPLRAHRAHKLGRPDAAEQLADLACSAVETTGR